MRTATALMVLAFVALAGAAAAQRQDEALDSLMLSSSLQPVDDPIPRLLQEALASAATKPGTYGGLTSPSPIVAPRPSPIATEVVPPAPAPSPKPKSGSSSAAAGAVSLAAAAAAAALLL